MQIILLATLIWFSAFHEAKAKSYCTYPAEVKKFVQFCESNLYFAEEADSCLRKFKNEIAKNQALLDLTFSAHSLGSRSAQDSKFQNASQDLKSAKFSLEDLIARGEQAKVDIQAYERGLLYPGNPGPDMIAQYRLDEFFAETSCHAEYKKMLQKKQRRLNSWLDDLKRAATKSSALKGNNQLREGKLAQSSPNISAQKFTQKGNGSGEIRGGGQRRTPSTITGTIKSQKLP